MENIPEFIANHLFLFSLLIGILSLLLWNIFGNSFSGLQLLTPAEVTRMINHEKGVVLDIRNETDFNHGHIINAVNFPTDNINKPGRIDTLKKFQDRPVILCCQRGMESGRFARVLKQNNFEKLYSLKGGIQAWQNTGMPLDKKTG